MLWVRANPRPFLHTSTPMAVGKSGLGFALTQSRAEIRVTIVISWLCFELEQIRDHFSQPPWGYLIAESGLGFALTWSLRGQGHVGQVRSKKGAQNELKMVPAVPRGKITHARQISAQSEQLCERYSKFNWFLKIACLRYEGPWGQDCVSGVRPCLVHSQKLSELTGHSDGGQNPYRTAVRPIFHVAFFKLPKSHPSLIHVNYLLCTWDLFWK